MNANKEAQSAGNGLDKFKWVVVVVLLALAVWGNYYFALPHEYYFAPVWRITSVVVVIVVAIALAFLTASGKAAWLFAKEARIELRKVIWPTRQETIQTTLIVIAVTAVVSLILWGLDSLMVTIVSFITSLGV